MEEQLQRENESLEMTVHEIQSQLRQVAEEKAQIQKCYDLAIQEVADGEARRETAERELKFAHNQIDSMWGELKNLRMRLDSPPALPVNHAVHESPILEPTLPSVCVVADDSMALLCSLCKEKINNSQENPTHFTSVKLESLSTNGNATYQQHQLKTSSKQQPQKSRKSSWLFGRKQSKIQEVESTSKVSPSPPHVMNSPVRKLNAHSTPNSPNGSPSFGRKFQTARVSNSPCSSIRKGEEDVVGKDYLIVNVTRSSQGATDMAPFKIVTKTNMSSFLSSLAEVHRSQGDFQWLYSALQGMCPERIVPPLRPPISLDATISEFQRFLSRLSAHKVLSKNHLFVVFLSGTAEELRVLRAKHRPHRHANKIRYKPAVGRDTNSGPLVDTKDYLTMLEQNLAGLSSHLEQSARKGHGTPMERAAHWFRAISDSEPDHTYLKRASTDLARTCEGMEGQLLGDSDELLFIQNLHSLTDYIRVAQELLTRVEEAVDQYLYWDEELTLIESVNSSSAEGIEEYADVGRNSQELVCDDSGVSDVASSGSNSNGEDNTLFDSHMTVKDGSHDSGSDVVGTSSERWAHASKQCADSKEFLEQMCSDLTEELSLFDLHKEKEIKQILIDYASAQLERHEKFQGKWFAIKYLLDTAISLDKRAIQFIPHSTTPITEEDQSAGGV